VSEIKALSEFDASENQSSRGHESQDIISPETPRINPGRPSARAGGKGSGAVGVFFIGVFDGREIVQQEIAIHDFPRRSELVITRTDVRDRTKVTDQEIEVFKDMKPLHHKAAICEFPTPS
jgi:hypothetical protein